MGDLSQEHRQLGLETELGKDVLLIEQASGQEGLSQLFRYRVQAVSEDDAVNFNDIMGTSATVRIEVSESGPTTTRYINGIVSQISQVGHDRKGLARYELILVPWFWLLTRTSDCRIFQNKSVMEIIKEIFSDHDLSDYEDKTTGSYEVREYCVQYGETAFNFVQRLMEHEGIYYFFKHEDGVHKLVFCDDMGAHEPLPGFEQILHRPKQDWAEEKPAVHSWQACGLVTPGTFVLNSFDFEAPVPSSTSRLIGKSTKAHAHAWGEGEIYENSSDYVDRGLGESWAKVRREEMQTNARTVSGETSTPGVIVGMTFELTESPREDQNAEYLVTDSSLETHVESYSSGEGNAAGHYSCSFAGIPKGHVYRPPRGAEVPRIPGPQTALVVGPSGEEIYTDEFGRVKVQFIWDRYGKSDAGSSCWVRVSQPWAGKGYGGLAIPRIGQEVIVEFIDGDPDRPIITGRVYNGEQGSPQELPEPDVATKAGPQPVQEMQGRAATLPDAKTRTAFKSNSTPGGGGANEISLDDASGQELLFINATKDSVKTVANNEVIGIGGNRYIGIGGNLTQYVAANRDQHVDGDETLHVTGNQTQIIGINQIETIGANQTVTIGANQVTSIGGSRATTVANTDAETIGAAKALSIGGAFQVSVGGAMNETVGGAKGTEVGGKHVEVVGVDRIVKAGSNIKMSAGGNVEIKTGGAKVVLKSSGKVEILGVDVKIQSGAGMIHIDAGGIITIKGPMVKINT
jgi:type VI secretion system secreted protein VgrG